MPQWYLNAALTAWRSGIDKRFPRRGRQSDGTIGDTAHSVTSSQHNPDEDGSVDSFDMDVNLQGSSNETGTAAERALIEALKKDFENDPRSQLWIHQRQIANRDVSNWKRRPYTGPSPHDHHVHWQTRQAKERDGSDWKYTNADALLRRAETTLARKATRVKITTTFPELKQGDRDDHLDGYNMIGRIQAITGSTRDGIWGPATTAGIADWCGIDKTKATKLTEDIFRKVFGLPASA